MINYYYYYFSAIKEAATQPHSTVQWYIEDHRGDEEILARFFQAWFIATFIESFLQPTKATFRSQEDTAVAAAAPSHCKPISTLLTSLVNGLFLAFFQRETATSCRVMKLFSTQLNERSRLWWPLLFCYYCLFPLFALLYRCLLARLGTPSTSFSTWWMVLVRGLFMLLYLLFCFHASSKTYSHTNPYTTCTLEPNDLHTSFILLSATSFNWV